MKRILKIQLDGESREVILGSDEMKEFTTKFQTIGIENSLQQFIVNDIGDLLENELYETQFNQLFNY
jgi:negative regulator of sigma E activity